MRNLHFWHKDNNKGSLTVEACIALPVFLCFFFLLLFFVKIACINIELDHAVKETARQIAASAYPLNFVNEYVDMHTETEGTLEGFFAKEVTKIKEMTEKEVKDTLATMILTGKVTKPDLEKYLGEIKGVLSQDTQDFYQVFIYQYVLPQVVELKETGQGLLVQNLLKDYLGKSNIQPEQLRLSMVELPQSYAEYHYKKENSWYQETGLEPDHDFDRNDTVIQVDYIFRIPLPFFGQKELVLRHTAVERAWLAGGNGVYAANRGDEEVDISDLVEETKNGGNKEKEPDKTYVFLCKSKTEVYHTRPDCDYLGSQVRVMTKEEAEALGLRAHGGCPRRFK